MSEEAKKDDEVTIADLKEVIDGQSHRIDALTSLVRAQQVTMDRLLRAVEKGAAIPSTAALPPPAPAPYATASRPQPTRPPPARARARRATAPLHKRTAPGRRAIPVRQGRENTRSV